MSYDRVAYSDKRPFSGEEYADDPFYKDDKRTKGNGVYNDYTVEVQPASKPAKFMCFTCKNTKRAKYTMIAALIVLFLCIVLVVVSALAHVNHSTPDPKPKRQFGE